MTCPNGEIAGVTTGSRVIGSINLGKGFVSSTVGFPSSPHLFLYLSVRLTADHLYKQETSRSRFVQTAIGFCRPSLLHLHNIQ